MKADALEALAAKTAAPYSVCPFRSEAEECGCESEHGYLYSESEHRAALEPQTFNMNDKVWVRLLPRGLAKIAGDPFKAAVHQHRKEVDGWTEWQLWELMSTLGGLCIMGPQPPFETEIRLTASASPEVAALRGQTWQPIETLLDSDCEVLMWSPLERLYLPEQLAKFPYLKPDVRVSTRRQWTWATLWMPLPPAPKEAE